jgi:hypothetical protein
MSYFTDSTCDTPVEKKTSDPIHDMQNNTTVYMQDAETCKAMTKTVDSNFWQTIGMCPKSDPQLCFPNDKGGEVCLQNVNNTGQFMSCYMMPPEGSVPDGMTMDSLSKTTDQKVTIDCNGPSSECKMQ